MAEVTPLIRDELVPPRGPERRHLISIADLTREDVERLLALARTFSASLQRDPDIIPRGQSALKRPVVEAFGEPTSLLRLRRNDIAQERRPISSRPRSTRWSRSWKIPR